MQSRTQQQKPNGTGTTPRSRLRTVRWAGAALMLLAATLFGGQALAQAYPDSLSNTVTLTVDGVDNIGDSEATDTNTLEVVNDLSVEKTLLTTGPEFLVGQQVQYAIEVANDGPSLASGVEVNDIPTNMTITAVDGAGCAGFPCTIPTLAPGATETITVTATISGAGAFGNQATVASPGSTDPDPGNNTDEAEWGEAAGPTATIAVAPDSVLEGSGQSLTYTVTLDVAPAVDTVVDLELGGTATPGTDFEGAVTSVTIPAGSTTATFEVTPLPTAEIDGSETVVITIVPGDLYAVGTPDSATGTIVQAAADLSITKTFNSAAPFVVGQLVEYTIEVTNAGPSAATSVQVTDTPTNLEIETVTGACTTLPCTIDSIGAGDTATIELSARIIAAGAFSNSAAVESPDVTDPNPGDNEDDGGGGEAAAPSTTITVAPDSVGEDAGEPLVFTISVDVPPAVDTVITLDFGGTATPGEDYTGAITTVTIPAGETSVSFEVVPLPDDIYEGDETVVVTVVPGTGYEVGPDSEAVGTIIDSDLPTADLSVSKSDGADTFVPGGSAIYVITVSNAGPNAAPGVEVTDNLPSGVTLSGPWSCEITAGGGACASAGGGAAGDGVVNVTVDLEADGEATITVPVVFSADPADY